MKALVTGAHGFLGRHVARLLSRSGYAVVGVGHGTWTMTESSNFGVKFWHQMDVTIDALTTYGNSPDVIVHCAGSGSVGFSMSHPYQDFNRTVGSTAAVLEYIRLYSPKTAFVYPSSAAVYGNAERLPLQEANSLNPVSPYGTHKLLVERLCLTYAQNYNISMATIRFFSIYGEGLRKQLLWDACNKASSGDSFFAGTGNEIRDWLHVEDAANLMRAAILHASPSNPTVNGGTGTAVTTKEILTELFRAYGSSAMPVFTGNSRPGDPPGYQADISKGEEWQWRAAIPWREGVNRYVTWFKREKN